MLPMTNGNQILLAQRAINQVDDLSHHDRTPLFDRRASERIRVSGRLRRVQKMASSEPRTAERMLGKGESRAFEIMAAPLIPELGPSLHFETMSGTSGRPFGEPSHVHVALHKTGAARATDPAAKIAGLATRVGADSDLVERTSATAAEQ